jgi:hypothetical protein
MQKTKQKAKNQKEFNEILLQAIDLSLLSLGEKTRFAVYHYLETGYAISKQEIPDKIEDFVDALEQIFGAGAPKLQLLIMKHIKEKVNADYKWSGPKWLVPDLNFVKYVKLMQLSCESDRKIGEMEVVLDAEEQQKIQQN